MHNLFLTKQQTLFYKGLAILFILLHNFFHWLPPITDQNELNFNYNLFALFLKHLSFTHLINDFFSFFGHYAVFVFIFLSGYGLSRSFLKNQESTVSFVLRHIVKIYILFLLCVFSYILYCSVSGKSYYTNDIFYTLLLTNNFSLQTIYRITGPWWFFSLIIQLYICFVPLFYWLKKKSMNYIFLLIFYIIVAEIVFLYFRMYLPLFLANAPAHLPEFGLGIWVALNEDKLSIANRRLFNAYLLCCSLLIIILAQIFYAFFIFSYIAAVILMFSFTNILNFESSRFLEFSGRISPYLFGINGFFLRSEFVRLAYNSQDLFMEIYYCLLWIFANYILASLIYFSIQKLSSYLNILHKPF